MEPARVSTLLDHGWSIVGQLHQWLSTSRHEFHDRDELVVLIRELQTFWGRVDDLELKRFARNTLALEQFFESLCAKRLEVTPGHLDDLQAGIACFEDLLLGFEATGEEPKMTQLDLLSRLEQHPRQQRSSERPTRTIEVDVINHDRQLEAASTDLIEVPSPRPIKLPQRIANTTRASQRLEQKVVPRIEPFIFTRFENPDVSPPQEVAASPLGEQDLEDSVVDSNRVLILEESLFYRHLTQIALRSAGYDTEMPELATGNAIALSEESLVPCGVILVTPFSSWEMASQIQQIRSLRNVKVIGLTGTDPDEAFGVELDACVVKSKPQQLISVLGQLLDPESGHPRKIA